MHALQGLRNSPDGLDIDDSQVLSSRFKQYLTDAEIAEFDDAFRIFFYTDQVTAHNHARVRDLGKPIWIIYSILTSKNAKNVDFE